MAADGAPSLRMVLLKAVDARGFVFYTNTDSRKGVELAQNPRAALCFHWKALQRQVRIEGMVEAVGDARGGRIFRDARPRQPARRLGLGAIAPAREPRGARAAGRRGGGTLAAGPVPRPPNWAGYRVLPRVIEFWEERPFRLHDRIVYRRVGRGLAA